MSFVLEDRIHETTTDAGSGPAFALTGAAPGKRRFSAAMTVADTTFGTVAAVDNSKWVTGFFTYTATDEITVTTIYRSSEPSNAMPSFSAGPKDVFMDIPGFTGMDATGKLAFMNALGALPKSGGTMTGPLSLSADAANAMEPVTLQQAQSLIAQLQRARSVRAMDTTDSDPATSGYTNGQSLGGVTVATGDTVLRNSSSNQARNGVWVIAASGAASRASDFDTYDEHPSRLIAVEEGASAETMWLCSSNKGGTFNSTAITFVKVGVGLLPENYLSELAGGTAADRAAARAAIGVSAAPGGRLTLTSGVPVMVASVAAATTVYYTPYIHDQILLYDGTNFVPTIFAELSQATSDTTKSPAAVTTNSNYDLFVWNDGGTVRLSRGPAWSSGTSRGTGAGTTELERVNGVWLNKVAITNGPAAQRGTYVGTIRSDGSSQINYSFSAAGSAALFGVWNLYNRVNTGTWVQDQTSSWTYNSATIRAANGSNNNRVTFVLGMSEDVVTALYSCYVANGATSAGSVGIALDATNTNVGIPGQVAAINNISDGAIAHYKGYPGVGVHYLQATEWIGGSNNSTFYGTQGNAPKYGNGLQVELRT